MPTKPGGYHLKNGEKVPSVTTVISNCKIGGIEPLLYWANQEGLSGRNYKDSREKAADAGTCVHERVECYIRSKKFDDAKYDPEILSMAEAPFAAFLEWANQSRLELVAAEMALVSEEDKFGGTLDAIAINEKLVLVDFKTSSGVYPEYLIQVAAYGKLWNENNPDYQVEGYSLLRFSKQKSPDQPISFSTYYWKHLDQAWCAFLHMRELYELTKTLKRMT